MDSEQYGSGMTRYVRGICNCVQHTGRLDVTLCLVTRNARAISNK